VGDTAPRAGLRLSTAFLALPATDDGAQGTGASAVKRASTAPSV
jgi:hypothetical protein